MAYDFKKLSEVDAVTTPANTANVLIEEDGVVKRVPANSVGGFKTVIITDNAYDLFVAGQIDSLPEEQVFTCPNMTYEEACEILDSGEIFDVYIKFATEDFGPNIAHGIISPLHNLEDNITIGIPMGRETFVLFWTADGFNTYHPSPS